RGDLPIEIGANPPRLHVGKPRFEVAPETRTGSGEELAAWLGGFGKLGINHLGIRFETRSCDELVEQIAAFGSEVMPHLEGS
ncbi:MAG: LLM class F420-dependent oxidoreductase, partial [Candidatus Binatia bacterium]